MSAPSSNSSHKSEKTVKVAVIGAGIIGIASAVRILQSLPQCSVTVFTDKISPNTTGDVAAGFWSPVYLTDTPAALADPWCEETYQFLLNEFRKQPDPQRNGLFLCPGFMLYSTATAPEISWSHVPIGFRKISNSELHSIFCDRYRSGYYFMSVMAEGRKFIPVLMDRFFQLGGKLLVNKRINSFKELSDLGYNRIVNCSGIGAKELCGDELVKPIRGQVLRVLAPWMNFWMIDDRGTYCLPNSDTVVIGGVSQSGNWSLQVQQKDREDILQRVGQMWPALKSAPILCDSVGLRPGRDCVRVERQIVDSDLFIYHNYGHGGAGLTLFWGCAGDIVRLIGEDIGAAAGDSVTAKL